MPDDPVLELHLDGFDGPLDLLLDLARAQKVDLARISILALVEQFLAIVETARIRLDLAADWLVMVAWLTWLKSRLLLPPGTEAADEAEEAAEILAERLEALQSVRNLAIWLGTRPQLGIDAFPRGFPEVLVAIDRSGLSADLNGLLRAYAGARRRATAQIAYQPAAARSIPCRMRWNASAHARPIPPLDRSRNVPPHAAVRNRRAPRRRREHAARRPRTRADRPDRLAPRGEFRTDHDACRRMTDLDHAVRLAEALIFASAEPVPAAALARTLPTVSTSSPSWPRCRRILPAEASN